MSFLFWLALCLLLVAVVWWLKAYNDSYYARMYWDWSKINTDSPVFPKGFVFGTSLSAYQCEGGHTNDNWTDWESAVDTQGAPRMKYKAGAAADHWNQYENDIKLMKEMNTSAHRFSLSWAKLEPTEGKYNDEAIRHYHSVLDTLRKANIEPFITLHHFSHPRWFEAKGAFEKESNIDDIIRFTEFAFKEFGKECRFWCTINEIEVYVANGYFSGKWPPGKKDTYLAGIVMKNMLSAHVRMFESLKRLGGDRIHVGFVKNIFQFDPYQPLSPLDRFVASFLDRSMNESILEFYRSGHFEFQQSGVKVRMHNEKAPTSFDFIGLNYYSHYLVRFNLFANELPVCELTQPHAAVMTDMDYSLYPEGLYRAIQRVSTLKRPIFITENGIADRTDDRRHLFLRRYLYALSKACADGYNVKGYFYWSLMDNFEWDSGLTMKFGLCDMQRKLRDGSRFFVEVCKDQLARDKSS
eukprot:TRINITY_DN7641_c0_g1_i1.p1 TRINITY_DN7641_c0_g1~~TRINITY_DN7641_c0_g1_i1.p1  ORF type:complete len:467 (+),score=94.36 TRINITY_DN7641_c0_g1_i1:73-1473(+)